MNIKNLICAFLVPIFVFSMSACGKKASVEISEDITDSSVDTDNSNYENETPEIVEPSLEDISFADLQGMDKWVNVAAYSADDFVDIDFQDDGQKRDVIFKADYISFCRLRANGTFMGNSYTYRILSGDEIVYNYHGDQVIWQIVEKDVLNAEKKQIILKTLRGSYEVWLIPYDAIDWDRGFTKIKKDDLGYNTVNRYYLK